MNREKMLRNGRITHRMVACQMGGWKWGYPRGERIGIVQYEAQWGKWKSRGKVCGGITAANVEGLRAEYPDAFANRCGSIHGKKITS